MFSNNRRKRTAGREQKVLTNSFPFQLVLVTPDLLNTFYQQTSLPIVYLTLITDGTATV